METPDLGFTHRFVPAPGGSAAPTLLLLHGTGGDEGDLLGLGRVLDPSAALLSPRGKVLENGMPRFFRRLAEGVFDEDDLVRRTAELAAFVARAADTYSFDRGRVIAVGYSNGANIAACMLLLHPGALAGAVLFHAMTPLVLETTPDLSGTPVFLGAGRSDPLIPPRGTEDLAARLRAAGAEVRLSWQPGGHALTQTEVEAARVWFRTQEALPS